MALYSEECRVHTHHVDRMQYLCMLKKKVRLPITVLLWIKRYLKKIKIRFTLHRELFSGSLAPYLGRTSHVSSASQVPLIGAVIAISKITDTDE